MTIHSPRARSSQAGFTLVEVLVALIVLSIGMLGMADWAVHELEVRTLQEFHQRGSGDA